MHKVQIFVNPLTGRPILLFRNMVVNWYKMLAAVSKGLGRFYLEDGKVVFLVFVKTVSFVVVKWRQGIKGAAAVPVVALNQR